MPKKRKTRRFPDPKAFVPFDCTVEEPEFPFIHIFEQSKYRPDLAGFGYFQDNPLVIDGKMRISRGDEFMIYNKKRKQWDNGTFFCQDGNTFIFLRNLYYLFPEDEYDLRFVETVVKDKYLPYLDTSGEYDYDVE